MTTHAQSYAEANQNLAEALVVSSNVPLLLLDGDLDIVSISASFLQAFQLNLIPLPGGSLAELGNGEWNSPRLRSLLKATAGGQAAISAYEMDLVRVGRPERKLVLNVQKLNYGDEDVRVLLTIADVTDARLAEKLKYDLLRDKAILLQELQHRVANSLQIIASVLMLSARRVSSDETRRHLYDAHNRVISVATLQQRLSQSTLESVHLGSYLTDLCESIAASMIVDPQQLFLTVQSDDSVAEAEISVSLGLIVTELVINALKHAFPGGRRGTIKVSYLSDHLDWTLKVHDDGVGMPPQHIHAKAGLGSSIVTALAQQLGAQVEIVDGQPGTEVRIVHLAVRPGTEADLPAAI